MSLNVFQIWDSLGQKTPFAVRKSYWAKESYTVITKIEIRKMPYGKAFGFFVKNGWKGREEEVRSPGVYDWSLVEGVALT